MKPHHRFHAALLGFALLAQATHVSAQMQQFQADNSQELAIQLHARTAINLTAQEMQEEGQALKDFPADETGLAQYLQAEVEKQLAGDPDAIQRSKAVSWKSVARAIRERADKYVLQARTLGRTYGIGTLLVFCTLKVTFQTLPLILLAVGQPEAAAAVFMNPIPVSNLVLVSDVSLKKLIRHHKIVAAYGGSASFHEHKKLDRETRTRLELYKNNDVLFPLPQELGAGEYAVFSNDGLTSRVLGGLHVTKKRLSLGKIKSIARKHGMTKSELKELTGLSADRAAVSSLLFSWVLPRLSTEEISNLRGTLPHSFTHVGDAVSVPALEDWAVKSLKVKTCDDLEKLVSETPETVPVPLVTATWNSVVFPQIVERFEGFHAKRFKKTVKASELFVISGRLAIDEVWDKTWTSGLGAVVQNLCAGQGAEENAK